MNPLRALFLSLSRMPPAVMLLLIVGLAVLVTFVVMGQVGDQQKAMNEQQAALKAKLEQKATVVYATKDIPEGTTISMDALEEKEIAAGQKPVDAFESAALVSGRTAKGTIPAGQVVSSHDLAAMGGPIGFEGKIKDGYRAVTFSVDASAGVAGFVAPGSHVDIIAGAGSGPDTKVAPVLSDVEVIAVGGTYQRQPAAGGAQTTTTGQPVTVALTPSDAGRLIKSIKAAGGLYLTLRNDKDHAPVPVVDVSSLFQKNSSAHSDLAALPPPPAQLPPPPGGGGLGALPMPPAPPAQHEVEQWSAGSKEVRSVPKD